MPASKHHLILQILARFIPLVQLLHDSACFFQQFWFGQLPLAPHHPTPREETVSFHYLDTSWSTFGTDNPLYYLISGASVSIQAIKLHKMTF